MPDPFETYVDESDHLAHAAQSQKKKAKAQKKKAKRLRRLLRNLLAVIHRDGGEHTAEVGIEQSVRDAHSLWAKLTEAAEAAGGDDVR